MTEEKNSFHERLLILVVGVIMITIYLKVVFLN